MAAPDTSGLRSVTAGAVDGIARGEVVAAIQHDVGLRDQFVQARFIGADRQRDALDLGVDLMQRGLCRNDFGLADHVGAMDDLALQVAEVHRVVVAQGETVRHRWRPDTAQQANPARRVR